MMQDQVVSNLNLEAPALRQVGALVAKVQGVNLAQGLCIMPTPEIVKDAAQAAIRDGLNLYSPAQGIPELRSALSKRLRDFNKIKYEIEEIVVTTGSTGAFEAVCQAFIEEGDEVICFYPFYPYHQNALARCKAKVKYVHLNLPDWSIDFDELAAAFSWKTKFLLLASPGNPTGKVYTRSELEKIAALCQEHDVFCVTDEVYEYITYSGRQHISMASLPGMYERTITMSSYSKTFAITGWRIGFLAAPQPVADVLRVTFDQTSVCAPTPLQHGVAAGVSGLGFDYYENLLGEYSRKRDIILPALQRAGFQVQPPQGAYYLVAGTSELFPGKTSEEVVQILIEQAGVGAVPACDFVGAAGKGDPSISNFLRFSYAVPDEMLERAATNLAKL